MPRSSERKATFSAIALASEFLHEAEKRGLTRTQLQRLRESPERMAEFAQLAKNAEEDYFMRVARLQYEKECAVDIDGTHYHLVLVTCTNLKDWGCEGDASIEEAVSLATHRGYIPLREEAYPTVPRVIATITSLGQWIGSTAYGGLVYWERAASEVKSVCSYGIAKGMLLSHFPELSGMVFMQKFNGCDHRFVLKG